MLVCSIYMEEAAKIDARFAAVGRSTTFSNIVRAFSLGNKAVLDIGCSYGEHLSHFRNGSVGLTISEEEAKAGKERGLDVRVGNAEDLLPEGTFDAVYCSNLLEHLYSPHAFLHNLRASLKPGGVLILGVPVLPFPRSLVQVRKFRGALAEQHINFFVKSTLKLTAERAGWNVRTVRGFHFSSSFIDRLCEPLYPHLYVVATPDPSFAYTPKRMKELAGYHRA